MHFDGDACYRAMEAKDGRFDGLFFVGVTSTGVYCRCVCSARTPKRANCTFHPNAAAAERAGFRPCRICRPELAPGRSRVDVTDRLAAKAFRLIEDGALGEMGVTELAEQLGISDRHLRRVVLEGYGVSPVELAQTHRLLLAKRLLTDTTMPMGEVAFASGFSSLRRFNALFQERYRMKPSDLRRRSAPQETFVCEIGYRPPYAWDAMIDYLGGRTIAGVEEVQDGAYARTVAIGEQRGWIRVRPSDRRHALAVEVSSSLAPVLPKVLRRVRRQFDTAAEPTVIDAHLGELARSPGVRVPGAFEGFEVAVRAILGQQVSVKAARTLAGRIAARYGRPIKTPFEGLTHTFPGPDVLADADFEGIGLVTARARTINALARAVRDGEVRLVPGADVEATTQAMKALPGIGEWTAQYVAMRALGHPDAFPHTDLGIYKALDTRDPREVLRAAEAWRPWRSYAAIHLWRSLE